MKIEILTHERAFLIEDGKPVTEDAGSELAIIYKQGRCKNRCGYTARSSKGRVVNVDERPPRLRTSSMTSPRQISAVRRAPELTAVLPPRSAPCAG